MSPGFPAAVSSDCLYMLNKSIVKVCDKAAVFSYYFLSALLQKEFISYCYPIALPLDIAFFLRKRNWGSETASNALGSSRTATKDVYCPDTDERRFYIY